MAEKEKDVKVKPKSPLVRLNGTSSPNMPRSRLPGSNLVTFKAPRDLTLGAAQAKGTEKKKFVPNLNVTRKIKTETESEKKTLVTPENRRKHVKKEKPDKHVRKERPQLIQTTGSIFSEGVGSGGIRRRIVAGSRVSGGGGGGEEGISQSKITTSLYNKEEEEDRLRELMRDDFIDDLKTGDSIPVQLPMITTGKIFQESELVSVKTEPASSEAIKPTTRRGVGVIDSDDDEDDPDDVKPPLTAPVPPPETPTELSAGDIIKSQNGDLFFIQLPDHLPGQTTKGKEGKAEPCQLDTVEEGLIGRLQIRKSGACQLVLGEQILNVEVGTKVGFLQDAMSVELPENEGEKGKMTMLGHVRQRLVVTPNWDHLMNNSGLCSDLA